MLKFLVVILYLFLLTLGQETKLNPLKNCRKLFLKDSYKEAYVGWPHRIACSLFVGGKVRKADSTDFDLNSDLSYYDDVTQVLCRIRDDENTTVFNATMTTRKLYEDEHPQTYGYLIPQVERNSSLNYTIDIFMYTPNSTHCITMQVDLNVTSFKQLTCDEFIKKQQVTTIRFYPSNIGSTKYFACSVKQQLHPKVYIDAASNVTFDYKWLRNCSKVPNDTTLTKLHVLRIAPVSFEDAGIYTCSVTYKGMTRYIASEVICPQHKLTTLQPTMTCTEQTLKKNIGNNAVFECHGNFGEGQVRPQQVDYRWEKMLPGQPTYISTCALKTNRDEKISCTFQILGSCYLHVASQVERRKQSAIVPVQLRIRKIEKSDYGTYVLWIGTNNGKTAQVNVTLTLAPNPNPELNVEAFAIGITLGVLSCVILLTLLALYFRIYVLVYYKRFFGAYVTGSKKYGAVLQYNFSQELDSFAQVDVKESVKSIREVLEDMGFSVYDENRDGYIEETRTENIRMSIERSHRIVILLTLEFIKDGWSMLALQKGFDSMIQSGSKLIFILLPGVMEYLKQHSKEDDTCLMILRAMKLNSTTRWSNKKGFNKKRFCFEIEYAMPKLEPRDPPHPESASLKDDAMLCDYKDPEYFRSMRNGTGHTVIEESGSPNGIVVDANKNKNNIRPTA